MNERIIDDELNIETCVIDNTNEDSNHRAYEPTPYDVLDLIIEEGIISQSDRVVDMGCGKGRVGFYLSRMINCHVTGIEYDEVIYNKAVENLSNIKVPVDVEFINIDAEKYGVKDDDTVFYFFNPFSDKILAKVLSNIEESFYKNPREIKLIFYYPTLEYVGELTARRNLDFIDEIDCSDLYKDSKGRECVMIFGMG